MVTSYATILFFFFNDTATNEIYTLSLHDALPISSRRRHTRSLCDWSSDVCSSDRSEEHTSELQSHSDLVCRLLLGSEEHTSELQSHSDLVCRLLLEKKKKTSELQSPSDLVCRRLREERQEASSTPPHLHVVRWHPRILRRRRSASSSRCISSHEYR